MKNGGTFHKGVNPKLDFEGGMNNIEHISIEKGDIIALFI